MKPVKFPHQNCVYGDTQAEYYPLPAHRVGDEAGRVISCWQLTDEEVEEVASTGKVWLTLFTFNGALQPVAIQATDPFRKMPVEPQARELVDWIRNLPSTVRLELLEDLKAKFPEMDGVCEQEPDDPDNPEEGEA